MPLLAYVFFFIFIIGLCIDIFYSIFFKVIARFHSINQLGRYRIIVISFIASNSAATLRSHHDSHASFPQRQSRSNVPI